MGAANFYTKPKLLLSIRVFLSCFGLRTRWGDIAAVMRWCRNWKIFMELLSKLIMNIKIDFVFRELVTIFLKCCETCHLKKGKAKKGVVIKPILSTKQNERCQVNFIFDYQLFIFSWTLLICNQSQITNSNLFLFIKTI